MKKHLFIFLFICATAANAEPPLDETLLAQGGVVGTNANGEQQTTVVDENGNLKMVPMAKSGTKAVGPGQSSGGMNKQAPATTTANGIGMSGQSTAPAGAGVAGQTHGPGVAGQTMNSGVAGQTSGSVGVAGQTTNSGVAGQTTAPAGMAGQTGAPAVSGQPNPSTPGAVAPGTAPQPIQGPGQVTQPGVVGTEINGQATTPMQPATQPGATTPQPGTQPITGQ